MICLSCRGVVRSRRRRGFALLVVLLAVVLLSVALAGYTMKTTFAHQLARSRAGTWKLLFAARAAVEESKARLHREAYDQTDANGVPTLESLPVMSGLFRIGQAEEHHAIYVAPERATLYLEGVEVTVRFEDEAGKLPVNALAAAEGRSRSMAISMARLFDIIGLRNSTMLASSVRDYIDPERDSAREPGDRKGAIYHISELATVRGFDANLLFVPSREGMPAAADCLSTWHVGHVNINSAQESVLAALAPRLTRGEIAEIITQRAERPFSSAEDFAERVSVQHDAQAQLRELGGFTTDTFTLYVEARWAGYIRRVKAVVWIQPEGAYTLYFGEGWDY